MKTFGILPATTGGGDFPRKAGLMAARQARIVLQITFALLFPVCLLAQPDAFNPEFELFTLPGDKAGNRVNCIAQDSAGFLWFGSHGGLHRYDGRSFVTYRHDSLNVNSLASDYIEWVFIDHKGVIWLPHWDRAAMTAFDPSTESFTRYIHDPKKPESLGGTYISMVTEDLQGYIWIATDQGLDRLDRHSGKFKHFRHNPADPRSLSNNYVRSLYVDREGILWVGTGFWWDETDPEHKSGGLNRYDARTESFQRYLHDPDYPNTLINNQVRGLFEDSRGGFWVGTRSDGLHRLNRLTGAFTRFPYNPMNPMQLSRPYLRGLAPSAHLASGNVSTITEDLRGHLWIGAEGGGINVWDPSSDSLWHFELPDRFGQQYPNNIWQCFVSRDGTVWIAEGGAGEQVFKVKQRETIFRFFKTSHLTGEGRVLGILKDPAGDVWVGASTTAAWLLRYGRDKKVQVFYPDDAPPIGHSPKMLYHLAIDRDGNLWISTGNGLYCRDQRSGKTRHFRPEIADNITFGPVFQDRKGYIWAGGWSKGLYRLDPRNGRFQLFAPDPGAAGSIGGPNPWGFYEDPQGTVWVCGGDLDISDQGKPTFIDRFNPYDPEPVFKHFFKEGRGLAWNLTTDRSGNIWFLNNTYGLKKLDPASGVVMSVPLNNTNPLPNSLTKTPDEKFWISTNTAIYMLDPETGAISTIDYLPSDGTGIFSGSFLTSDGELLITRADGFLSFYPAQAQSLLKSRTPEIRITGFTLHTQPVIPGRGSALKQAVWQTEAIDLAYNQNVFAFSVSCFDFQNPEANRLEFMLENYDNDWRNDLFGNTTPTYLNVPPGKYIFRVRGVNSAGVWNKEGAAIQITVLPPWWRSWWAYCLYALLAGAVIRAWLQVSIRRARLREKAAFETREMERIKELDTLKTRLYTNITHELRTPLTIILGMARQALENPAAHFRTSQEMIIRNGEQLLSLVNEMLDLSKLENGKMQLHPVLADVVPLLRYIIESFHSLAKIKNLELHFLPDTEMLVMDHDPEKMRQIVSNLLSNAVKFTPAGGHVYLSVSTENEEKILLLKVKDTGPGISSQQLPYIFDRFYQADDSSTRGGEGTGIGLALVRELVKFIGGEIKVKSPAPGARQGTEFSVVLPILRNAALPAIPEAALPVPPVFLPAEFPDISDNGNLERGDPNPISPLVLLVEDNADVVAYLSGCLSGYRLLVAHNGQEGFDRATEAVPDLIISDVMMPVMDGLELCRRLKTDASTNHIPVVLLTARAGLDSKIEGLEHGADAYIEKPFAPEELLVHLKSLLELRRRLQHHYLQAAGLTKNAAVLDNLPELHKTEDTFVKKVREIVEVHIDDYDFNIAQLCREVLLSQSQLQRKLEALTGYSPNQFIRYVRLNKARELLRHTDLSITAVALDCGFSDPGYFGRVFKQELGVTPVEWRRLGLE